MFLSGLVLANNGISLEYPGNGIPLFSKDKPVKRINEKMIEFFKYKKGITIDDEFITFNELESDIYFKSQCFLNQKSFTLKIPFTINKGQITISIGQIDFVITATKVTIYENDTEIFSKDITETKGVSLSTGYGFDNALQVNAYVVTAGSASGAIVKLAFPAYITLKVSKDSVGTFGKLMWGRGYK